jgi:predicted ATPase
LTFTGLSPVAPLTFACFGSYLAKIGNVPVGYRFTSLARSLLDKLDAKEVAGEVILLSVEVRCFTEPMQALDDLKSEGEAAALSVGDSLWACLNRLQYCSSMFYAGTNLLIVYGKVMEARHFIKQQDENVLFFILVLERSLNILLGKEAVFFVTTIPRQKMRL